MKILLQYLIAVIFTLNNPHLPLPAFRTDQLVVDKTDPSFFRRQRTDQTPSEVRLRGRLMIFVHVVEICQNPRSKRKNIIDLKILLGRISFCNC